LQTQQQTQRGWQQIIQHTSHHGVVTDRLIACS
jgi:hypothetical protein